MGFHHKLVASPRVPSPKRTTLQEVKDQTFDYIVVGGGTSGCLLASRLATAAPSTRVLLVEAGGEAEDDPENLIPGLVVPKFGSEAGNWLYETAPQTQLGGRTIVYPRGRGMGGSSAVNLSSWVRGPKCDWDEWAERTGDEWWKWENAVGYMKDLEDFRGEYPTGMQKYLKPVEEMHHAGGPIGVGTGAEWQGLVKHCLDGAVEAGHALNWDHNDGEPMGVAVAQMNVDSGVRISSAGAFLGPAARQKLSNLIVVTGTISKRVVFEGKKAVGVELLPTRPTPEKADEAVKVHAKKEIVLTAGALASPHILLLSGIGPEAELKGHNIPIIHDLPAVGRNIQDHCAFSIEAVIDPSIPGQNQLLKDPEALASAQKQYQETKTGPLAVFGASAAVLFARIPELYASEEFKALPEDLQAFLSHPERPSTELWLHGGPLFYQGHVAPTDSVIAIEGLCQNLLSKGTLTLRSDDPRELPLVDPAYCTEPYDWRIAIETMKVQLKLLQSPAMQAILRKTLHGPGQKVADGDVKLCDPDDEEAIRRFLKDELTQGFHSMSSCIMGKEGNENRVVDAQFRVVGMEGLRIADMAVCPILTNNHTQINAYLIAERCAQVMLGEA